MTTSIAPSAEMAIDVKALAHRLVDRVYDQVESDYLNGRLNVGEMTRNTILCYERHNVQLESAVDFVGLPGLWDAVRREIDQVIAELRKRAADDEREYHLKMSRPYSYGAR